MILGFRLLFLTAGKIEAQEKTNVATGEDKGSRLEVDGRREKLVTKHIGSSRRKTGCQKALDVR
jgi:hypothetical protein